MMKIWMEEDLKAYGEGSIWQNRAGGFSVVDPRSPANMITGRLDVVRGLHGDHVLTCLNEK